MVAALGDGPFTVNGVRVTKAEFFGDPLVPSLAPMIIAAVWVAWGLWRERAWARPLMLGYWFMVLAPSIFPSNVDWSTRIGAILTLVIALTAASWYLYGKSNVVAYCQHLEERDRSAQ